MLYFISGKDKFRRQNEIASIKKQIFLDEELNGFNFQELINPQINDFSASIQTPAFAAGKKLILIKEFKPLANVSEDTDIERICASLKNKPTDNILLFDSEKINGALKLLKKIKKEYKDSFSESKFELFKSWDLKEASQWLCAVYPKLAEGKKLKLEIAEFITEQVGSEDSAKLYSELSRLINGGKELSIENLRNELDSKHDIFKLSKYLCQNQKQKALIEFEKIVRARELNIGLLAILETTISSSLKLKLAAKRYHNKNELAEFVGISPGRLYYQQQELVNVHEDHLNSVLKKLLKIERQVKTGFDQLERSVRRELLLT